MTTSATDLNSTPVTDVSVFLGEPFLPDPDQLRDGFLEDENGAPIEETDEKWERSYAEDLVSTGKLAIAFMDAGWRLQYDDGLRAVLPDGQSRPSWKALTEEAIGLGAASDASLSAHLPDGRLIFGQISGDEPSIGG